MAMSKQISNLINHFDFEQFKGWGDVEIKQAGLKYIYFYVYGDWKKVHILFRDYMQCLALECNAEAVQVDFTMEDDWGGDSYGGTYKFLIK